MNFTNKPVLLVALAILLSAFPLPASAQTAAQSPAPAATPVMSAAPPHALPPAEADNSANLRERPYLLGLIFLLLAVGVVYRLKRRHQPV